LLSVKLFFFRSAVKVLLHIIQGCLVRMVCPWWLYHHIRPRSQLPLDQSEDYRET